MKRAIIMLVLAIFIVNIAVNVVWAEEYRLDSGDVLTIEVWGYEKLPMREVMIRPDGRLSFPWWEKYKLQGFPQGN